MQAYESAEIKHAFCCENASPGIVHHGHSTLRVCIHCGRNGSLAELELALHSAVIKQRLALPIIIIIIIIIVIITNIIVLQVTIITERLTRQVTIITERLTLPVIIHGPNFSPSLNHCRQMSRVCLNGIYW
jgi:hypothetical protein